MIEIANKALLLRVGIDRGTGGALGPIFDDGTFEYVPIPEREPTRECRRYNTLLGQHGRPLAAFLPSKLAELHPHIDPDFKTAVYGDIAPHKRRQLAKLIPGDVLVFYCGLMPFPPIDFPRLFAVGYLYVKQVHELTASDIKSGRTLRHHFGRTAHFLRKALDPELVLVEGDRTKSRLFARALPLGDSRGNLLRDLEGLGYRGSILRAFGHWVRGDVAMEFLNTWINEGPRMLVSPRSRLFLLPPSSLLHGTSGPAGDLTIIAGRRPLEAGDWFLIPSNRKRERIMFFGRINRCSHVKGQHRAFSSVFWHFTGGGPVVPKAWSSSTLLRVNRGRWRCDEEALRGLVAWLASRYRVALIDDEPHERAQ